MSEANEERLFDVRVYFREKGASAIHHGVIAPQHNAPYVYVQDLDGTVHVYHDDRISEILAVPVKNRGED